MDRAIIITILCIFLIACSPPAPIEKPTPQVCFKDTCFFVEIADNKIERSIGLMNRPFLAENSGMLFIFDKEKGVAMWMKKTLIPLDIIWINKNRRANHVESNAQPCVENEKCNHLIAPVKALYVLEINAGKAKELGIVSGSSFVFKNIFN
tara:strand:+ start:644 stop:1096 length:453 start_codon:yes stop_codon:yes gene_type:complete